MAPKKILSRAEVLAAQDLAPLSVPVPEWGGHVLLRAFTASQRADYDCDTMKRADAFRAKTGRDPKMSDIPHKSALVAATAVDEAGRRLFSEADLEALAEKNAKVIDRLYDRAMFHNGYLRESLEELEGKLQGADGSASPSVSAPA